MVKPHTYLSQRTISATGGVPSVELGLYVDHGPITAGVWYRTRDAFIALIGFQTEKFKFGYSYDVTTSKLTTATAGSHEISMQLQFNCKPKKRRFRLSPAPPSEPATPQPNKT
jgi:hypothetical protein